MKFLVNVIRWIIIVYLVLYVIIMMTFFTKKKTYNESYPTILGYSYYKVDSDVFEPDIKKNNVVIFKDVDDIKIGDYVVYVDKKNPVVKKVDNIEKYNLILGDVTKTFDEIDGKMVYNNDNFSKIINILTNPVVLIVLLFVGSILPELIFDS